MYGVFGKFESISGQRDTLLAYLLEAAQGLQEYPTCYLYVVSVDPTDPNGIWVNEVWQSKEDHQASLALEATQKLIVVARPLISNITQRIEVTPVGGKGIPE